jgi:hypothetical protein
VPLLLALLRGLPWWPGVAPLPLLPLRLSCLFPRFWLALRRLSSVGELGDGGEIQPFSEGYGHIPPGWSIERHVEQLKIL